MNEGFFDLDCLDLALSISELDLDGSGLKSGGSHGPRWIGFEGRRKSGLWFFLDSLCDYQFRFLKEICLFEFGYLLFGLPCLALGLRIGVPGFKWIGVERGISHKGFQF